MRGGACWRAPHHARARARATSAPQLSPPPPPLSARTARRPRSPVFWARLLARGLLSDAELAKLFEIDHVDGLGLACGGASPAAVLRDALAGAAGAASANADAPHNLMLLDKGIHKDKTADAASNTSVMSIV